MAKKIYAVKTGRKPGIYSSWDECKEQVEGFSGAEYKSFKDLESAQRYMSGTEEKGQDNQQETKGYLAFVDGSFCSERVQYGWGLVCLKDGELIYSDCGGKGKPSKDEKECREVRIRREAVKMRNVAGELSAAMNALAWAKKMGVKITIVHDLEGTAKWYTGEFKAKNELTKMYVSFMRENAGFLEGFRWVKGHGSNENFDSRWNNYADRLAREGALNTEPDPKSVPLPQAS